MRHTTLWTALITPFQNGKIDFDTLDDLVHRQNTPGNGLVLLGSTGEGLSLSYQQQESIVRRVCQHDLDTLPIVRASSNCMEDLLDWIRLCNKLCLGGLLCPLPAYVKPGPEGQYAWFKTILEHTDHPVMIYNHPGRTGVSIAPEVIQKLSVYKNFVAIKEASGTPETFMAYKKSAPHISLFAGDDAMMATLAPLGAVGLISTASNAWPEAVKLYVQQCLAAQQTEASQQLWQNAGDALSIATNPAPIKVLLHLMGYIRSAELLPPLSCLDCKNMPKLEDINHKIEDWYKKHA